MADGCGTAQDFISADSNSIDFVTFNYDTVIEQFIEDVVRYRFGDSENKAGEYEHLPFNVWHVYGMVDVSNMKSDYRNSNDQYAHFWDMAMKAKENIRVIGEERSCAEKDVRDDIENSMARADRVIVIGFGWHPDNIKQVPWSSIPSDAEVNLGTYGVPTPVWNRGMHVLKSSGFKRQYVTAAEYREMFMAAKRGGSFAFTHCDTAVDLLREQLGLLDGEA